jgi:uncharacterized protein YprB with RNaseH-like and TPR domain
MLRNTFCHIPGIGPKSENNLWSRGILCWEDLVARSSIESSREKHHFLKSHIVESMAHLEDNDPRFFVESLASSHHWRLFPEFRDSVAYLDIETTGFAGPGNYITTIALYDGVTVRHYVHGQNLRRFVEDISRFKVVVTYNGRCFDVPFIENYFGIKMNHAQIDLRYVLHSLGYRGGLKGCEKALGLDREELDGVNGYFAVVLWEDFRRNNNYKALETLLAYNILDAVNLETLMVMAYNLKLKQTPFAETHRLELPLSVENPFKADRETVDRVAAYCYG